MRIVILGAKGLPGVAGAGGVERGLLETGRRFAAQGIDVVVYERGATTAQYRKQGMTVCRTRFFDRHSLAGWTHCTTSTMHALFHFRDADIHIVHCAQNGLVVCVLRLFCARVVFYIHGREWCAKKWSRAMRLAIWLNALLGCAASHKTLVVCRPSRMALSRWLPFCRRKIHIVPNGVPDMPQPSPSVNETDPFILYVGRIVPQKRIDLLIESFRQVQCDIKLILAGPTSHSYKYVSYLRSLSDGDRRIVWRGDTNHRELMLLYRQCTAVVLPSDHEGYSNVLLEALSAGCCIIASDIEENVAILRDAGLFFPNGNQEALTVLLQQIADERVPLQRLRYDAIIRSTQLPTWDDVVRRILRLCIPHFDTRTTTSRCP